MTKLILSDIDNLENEGSAVGTLNNNSDAIVVAVENTLSRDGTVPNYMTADLDMNGHNILNTANFTPVVLHLPGDYTASQITNVPSGTIASGNVQAALNELNTKGGKIFILATGQSNMQQQPSFSWSPAANAKVWNYNDTDGNVGTAFTAISGTTVNPSHKFASDVATKYSDATVYLLRVAIGSQEIAHWLPGAVAPDMYANITANISLAMAAAGVTKIDAFLWWEGENQILGKSYEYADNFDAMMTRFQAETWFPRAIPQILFGLMPSSYTVNAALQQNDINNIRLMQAAKRDPDTRTFVYTGILPTTLWDTTLHTTGEGTFEAGRIASDAYLYGRSATSAIIDPFTKRIANSVIGRAGYRNLIRGGDFSTTNPWQRGFTFTGVTDGSYTADGWVWQQSGSGVVDIKQTADAPTIAQAGTYTPNCLHIDVTTADASIANPDYYGISQRIEGMDVVHLGFGQTGARPITISFWVKATVAGVYFIDIQNSASNRYFCTAYTVNTSNTWERKEIILPNGDLTGTWLTTNGIGLTVRWTVASSDTYLFTPEVWGDFDVRVGSGTRVNGMSSTANDFKLALVQVEEGFGSTSFERPPQHLILDRARRYYRKSFTRPTVPIQNSGTNLGAACAVSHVAAAQFGTRVDFGNHMRAASPTITTFNPAAANANWRDITNAADRTVTVSQQSDSGFVITGASGAAAATNLIHWTASSEL